MRKSLSGGRRHFLGLADQGISSLTNLLLVSMMLRSLPIEEAGVFSLFYGLVLLALTAFRAYFGNRIVVQGDGPSGARRISQGAHAMAVSITVFVASLLGVVYLLAAGSTQTRLVFAVMGFSVLLVWQDLLRFTGMALDRQGAVLASDVVWLVVVAVGWTASQPTLSLVALVVGPGLALAVLLLSLRVFPSLSAAREFASRRHRASERWTLGTAVSMSSTYATLAVGTILGGPSLAAGLQAGLTVSSPPSLLSGYSVIGLTTWQKQRPRDSDVGAALALAAIGAAVTLLWAVLLFAFPGAVELLAGDSAALLVGVVWVFLVMRLVTLIATGAGLALRVREHGSLVPSVAGALVVVGFLAAALVLKVDTLVYYAFIPLAHALAGAAAGWWLLFRLRSRP